MPRGRIPQDEATRFWAKVEKQGEADEDCWIWTASPSQRYGLFATGGRNGRQVNAHRWAWEREHGPVPTGFEICHNCPRGDNKKCVRVSHMFLGTKTANINDSVIKGQHAHGEGQHLAKLTDEAVIEIRRLIEAGGITKRQIALLFGVQPTNITAISQGRTWKHLLPRKDSA